MRKRNQREMVRHKIWKKRKKTERKNQINWNFICKNSPKKLPYIETLGKNQHNTKTSKIGIIALIIHVHLLKVWYNKMFFYMDFHWIMLDCDLIFASVSNLNKDFRQKKENLRFKCKYYITAKLWFCNILLSFAIFCKLSAMTFSKGSAIDQLH